MNNKSHEECRAEFMELAEKCFEDMFSKQNEGIWQTFDEREEVATVAANNLGQLLLNRNLDCSRSPQDQEALCPKCRKSCPSKGSPGSEQTREIRTGLGPVELTRKAFECRSCRATFFPSGSKFESNDGGV